MDVLNWRIFIFGLVVFSACNTKPKETQGTIEINGFDVKNDVVKKGSLATDSLLLDLRSFKFKILVSKMTQFLQC